jgi:Fe2+ or Zn2+ uptake regulation protein
MQESSDHLYRQFANALLTQGLKQTQERYAILRAIIQLNAPFQIDFLRKQLQNQKYYVSRATLYNTVRLMEEIGVLDKIIMDGKLFYDINSTERNTYFLVNESERKMINIEKELENFIISHVEKKYDISIKGMKILFFET